jgi:hypothetical protein
MRHEYLRPTEQTVEEVALPGTIPNFGQLSQSLCSSQRSDGRRTARQSTFVDLLQAAT